jgi:hypothetical protein
MLEAASPETDAPPLGSSEEPSHGPKGQGGQSQPDRYREKRRLEHETPLGRVEVAEPARRPDPRKHGAIIGWFIGAHYCRIRARVRPCGLDAPTWLAR